MFQQESGGSTTQLTVSLKRAAELNKQSEESLTAREETKTEKKVLAVDKSGKSTAPQISGLQDSVNRSTSDVWF